MLFMVIERFKDPDEVKRRFAERGRMMPAGVEYFDSWIETGGRTCYQVMRTERRELLDEWMATWSDIVEFDVIPVVTSAEFNSRV